MTAQIPPVPPALPRSGSARRDGRTPTPVCPGRSGSERGLALELHSEIESYRATIGLHTPDGEPTTVIVMRRGHTVWVTLDGAIRTTVVMRDPEAGHLVDTITTARIPR